MGRWITDPSAKVETQSILRGSGLKNGKGFRSGYERKIVTGVLMLVARTSRQGRHCGRSGKTNGEGRQGTSKVGLVRG